MAKFRGDRYSCGCIFEDIVEDGFADILIHAGSSKESNVAISCSSDGNSGLLFYENPTVSNNGISMLLTNRNRRSSNTSDCSFWHSPTVTISGTLLACGLTVKHKPGNSIGSSFANGDTWTLDKDTYYLARIQNLEKGEKDFSVQIRCNEET